MRLVTFLRSGTERLGALHTCDGRAGIVDLNQVDRRIPADMIGFLEGGRETRALAEKVLATIHKNDVIDMSAIALKAPLPRPRKIIGIGLNYRDHAAETGLPIPDFPIVFAKYPNCVIGVGEAIVIPKLTQQVDYEGELGVVMGKRGRNISEEACMEYVAGYVIFNDVSARDYQNRTSQWTLGKTFDTFGPMGPALVTADEIPDPHNLRICTRIGNEVLQDSNTKNLIFSIPFLIACLSQIMTLEPGDLISTGTPAGVGSTRRPPRFLRPGDIVQIEIEALGVLSNPVVSEN